MSKISAFVSIICFFIAGVLFSNSLNIQSAASANDKSYLETCKYCLIGTHDATGKPIRLHVIFLENMKAVQDKANMFGYEFHDPMGFAHWKVTKDGVDCTIYTIHPRESNGPNTLVLGHEVLHCIIGEHHD